MAQSLSKKRWKAFYRRLSKPTNSFLLTMARRIADQPLWKNFKRVIRSASLESKEAASLRPEIASKGLSRLWPSYCHTL